MINVDDVPERDLKSLKIFAIDVNVDGSIIWLPSSRKYE